MNERDKGYGQKDIEAALSGSQRGTGQPGQRVNLIIDIQSRLQGKGPGYERWAKVFNLKQMAAALAFLQENDLMEYGQLEKKASEATERFHTLSGQIKSAEAAFQTNRELKAANKGRASPRPVKKKLSEELRLKQAELQCCRILSDYNHLLEKWKTEYAPETPGEEWHPLFVEALQKQAYTEYLLDTLLGGTAVEKAGIIKEHGKEVMRIGERISGFAASHKAGCYERSGLAPTGTDGR